MRLDPPQAAERAATTERELHTVPALLSRMAERFPARLAVRDEHGTLTFGALAANVARAAAVLTEAGVGPGDRVALWLPNSLAFVESFLGVLTCGAAAFPLASAAPGAEVRRALAEARARALIGVRGAASAVALADLPCLTANCDGLTIEQATAQRRPPSAPPRDVDPALVAYSFATLGKPELVVRTHENLWWDAEHFTEATAIGPDDVILGVLPLSHAHGLGNALLAGLRSGAQLIVRPSFLPRQTLTLLDREGVTVFPAVPFIIHIVSASARGMRVDLDRLRLCVSAGAPLTRDAYEAFRARFGRQVRQLYGLAAAGDVTMNVASGAALDPESVGTPIASVRVTIEDAGGREVERGTIGEIVVRSPAAAGGANHPLRTRDLGRWSERGELVITGRLSAFINTAGNKIDPGEVEAALKRHPAVAEAAVVGRPAPPADQVATAVVVRRHACTADDLRLHCRTLLASYKVPRVITFRETLARPARDDPSR